MAVSVPEYRFPYYRNHGFLIQEYSSVSAFGIIFLHIAAVISGKRIVRTECIAVGRAAHTDIALCIGQ